jgi:hypothetical protein
MDSSDLSRLARRTRWRYERSRAWRALWGFSPSALLVALATALAARPVATGSFGALLFLVGATLLWHGRAFKYAVLPGVAAGLVPLTLAICANRMGHACLDGNCVTVCLPACGIGGLGAGLLSSFVARRSGHGWAVWTASSATALLTGAMGCVCIGTAGLMALVLGYAAGSLPLAERRWFASK